MNGRVMMISSTRYINLCLPNRVGEEQPKCH